MTSVLCLPVAEQYPSNTATSEESTSTRISVTGMSRGLEVISDSLNSQNTWILRLSLRDLGKRCVFHAGSLRDLLVLAFVLVKHSERVGEKFFLCHERHFIAIYCYLQ